MFCSDEITVPLPSPMVTSGLALSGALFTQSVNHAEEETETDTSRRRREERLTTRWATRRRFRICLRHER